MQNVVTHFKRYKSSPLRILLSGSRGLIGSHLKVLLETAGHDVVALVRSAKAAERAVCWDPNHEVLCKDDFEGFDAVIHLAGESLAGGVWTKRRKEKIFLSRCRDTWLLSQVLARLNRPPRTLITASAVGFFGNRGGEEVTESSTKGKGFLADLCAKWENATAAIEKRGCRVVHSRFGMVLSGQGGALEKMLLLYKLGLGGKLGSGEQLVNWIAIDDVIGALYHILMNEALSGPVNVVAPCPVPQKEFSKVLAKKLHRPAWVSVPAWLLHWVLGEMADELLLSSARVKPEKLQSTGYTFRYPDLYSALDDIL